MKATMKKRFSNSNFGKGASGAVIVEFALIAPIIILINILIYDISTFYLLNERSQHATQSIYQLLTSDADHQIYDVDLVRADAYRSAVAGDFDGGSQAALVVVDAMPFYVNKSASWQFVVCWSWSSDPNVAAAPIIGSRLSPPQYQVNTWTPVSGLAASSAVLIVESHQIYPTLFGVHYLPRRSVQNSIGPIRYGNSLPINLLYSRYLGSPLLNDSMIRDPNASNAILCQR